MNKPLLKWSPALPIRRPDNIISSYAKPAFKPSYENETENMNFVMSNEYMRMWFKEKAVFEKDTYAREQIIKKERKIKRRIIQRMMTYRKPSKTYFIDDYVERKMGKSKVKDPDQIKKQLKFKPACPDSVCCQGLGKSKSKTKETKANKNDDDESDNCCEIVVCPIRQTG